MRQIAVLAGDGIGPEVMECALEVLKKLNNINNLGIVWAEALVGGAAIDATGMALPQDTINLCKKSDAILFGSIGGPKWEKLPPEQQPERAALLNMRKMFDLFANLRPAKIYPELMESSPLKNSVIEKGVDILILRELTGDVYFGQPKEITESKGLDTMVYTKHEVERIAHTAFKAAQKRQKKVTSIDKANALSSMVFWRKIVTEVSKGYPDVQTNHMYVDNAAMQLVRNPAQFDVMLCGNMFGDILSDEASMITGSLGMLPSASLNATGFGLYEPSGGSAPDIAGRNIANPIAQILSLALLLRYSYNEEKAAVCIENAITKTLSQGYRTADIYSDGCTKVNTTAMTDKILNNLHLS
ncbi:MAG TPA: 3-isopropylmalate dehydrogenase [Nitrospirota bacterium]|nr:3-isopropylmalate dehydrogenase [Nitrospirota bacterium]